MQQREGQNGQLPEDARRELRRCGAGNTQFNKELHAYGRLCSEDDKMDESYKILLVSLFMKENQFIMPQKMKRDGKLNEPLLPIPRFKRSEQLLRRGQYSREHDGNDVRQYRGSKDLNNKDLLIMEDNDDVREDATKALGEGFETPKKRKGRGLLIHYVDIGIHEVVGKGNMKQNGKQHLIEPEYDREDSDKTIFEPHKLCSKHHSTCENNEVCEQAFELEKKRKGKGLLVEHDDEDDENGGKALKERSKRPDGYNAVCENGGKTSRENHANNAKEYKSDYEIFLKFMEEYKQQSKKKSISKNAATIKIKEGVVSSKDNEPQPDVELPNQVPNLVKKPNVEKSMNDERVEADIEKRPAHPLSDKERPTRRSRKVIYNEYSRDEDRREEIGKHSSRDIRNVVTKKPRNENAGIDRSSRRSKKVNYKDYSSDEDENVVTKKPMNENAGIDIEKSSSRRSKKVNYKDYLSDEDEGVGIKKRHVCRSRKTTLEELRNKDEREEIEKHLSPKFRNVNKKKPDNEKTEADVEKRWSRRSRKVNYKECSSDEDVDLGITKHSTCRSRKDVLEELSDKDQREEIEKHLSREFRNIAMKKPKNKNAEADIEKCSSRRSRKVVFKEYSSDEDEEAGNEKHPACRSRKDILEELSSKDQREKIEKRLSREFRYVTLKKPKNKNADADIENCSSRRSRKVVFKEYLSDEDEDAGIEKFLFHGSRNVCSPNENKTEMLPLKRAARQYRKVAMKRPSVEDIEEEVKKFRNFLLKRSRYLTEGGAPRGHTKFYVGESSVRPRNIDEDSSEESEESSDSDSDVEILDMDECPNGPFVPSKRCRITEVGGGAYTLSEEYIEFRRQVLEVISKPFDKSEYKDLQAEFHGRCYPGYHQDLVKILKKNQWNPRKRLAILRGFFFWLQNLTRRGSFKPWHDRICLKVEPERPPPNNGSN